jgi:hypothetical protein
VEVLGIGRIGNRNTKPQWNSEDLAGEILKVLISDTAPNMRSRALELAQLCQKRGSGAMKVVSHIIEELQL